MKAQLMLKTLTAEEIAKAVGGKLEIYGDGTLSNVTNITYDSRDVCKGSLFCAIKGEREDGHNFIADVVAKGAVLILANKIPQNAKSTGNFAAVIVDDTVAALGLLAGYYRTFSKAKVIVITGSVCKTTTKDFVSSVTNEAFNTLKTEGNHNNEIGLPMTIFGLTPECEIAVLEMGISDFGEMHRLSAMSCPDIMVITNIGYCHLEFLGDRDGVLRAKTECFEHMMPDASVVLNGDDDKLATKQTVNGKSVVFYGKGQSAESCGDNSQNDNGNKAYAAAVTRSVYTTGIQNLGFDGMKAHFVTPQGEFDAQIHIPGEHNVYNAMAAAAVGLKLGLTVDEIKNGIEAAKTIAGRTNFIKHNNMTIIDDCYNANPVSMKSSIEVLSHASGRTIAVLGDMGELGSDEEKLHYEVGKAVGNDHIDALFCAGSLAKQYAQGAQKTDSNVDVHYFEKREDMTNELLSYVKEGDTILIKASHFMEFPKVVEALQA